MGLLGFQNRPAPGPEIFDFCGLNGPKPARNPFEMVERFAYHNFEWVLCRLRAVPATTIKDLRSANAGRFWKTEQSHLKTYLMLYGFWAVGPPKHRKARILSEIQGPQEVTRSYGDI